MNTKFDHSLVGHVVAINEKEYRLLAELIYSKFGINLGDRKRALVVGRLNKVLRKLGFDNFKDYYKYLKTDKSGQALDTLINRISTNHTFFNRESGHFDFFLHSALPEISSSLKRAGMAELRIWCPGCSSGEEPYLLGILMQEFLAKHPRAFNPKILATDISDRVLNLAKSGNYSEENVTKLPPQYKKRYFRQKAEDVFSISNDIKNMISFRRLNLIRDSYPFKKRFQFIFCRNVMIYFDAQTRAQLTKRFALHLDINGYLFIGHSESLGRNDSYFQYLKPAMYKRKELAEVIR